MLALHHLDFLQGLVFFPWQASDGSEETTAEDAVSCFFEIDFHLPAMTPADDWAASLSCPLLLQESGCLLGWTKARRLTN